MKTIIPYWLSAFLYLLFFVVVCLALGYYLDKKQQAFINECNLKGGAVLSARGMNACVDPKILK